jgi:hypothetical protein
MLSEKCLVLLNRFTNPSADNLVWASAFLLDGTAVFAGFSFSFVS